jgi:ATP-dependent Clp protease ATP-binding subunit ClpC
MRLLEDSLAEAILSGQVRDSDKALVDVSENEQVQILPVQQPVLQVLQPVG